MHKKVFLIQLLLSLYAIEALAYHFEVDGIYYNYDYWGGAVTDVYVTYNPEDPYVGKVTIPSQVTHYDTAYGENVTYNVTGIGISAFGDCVHLTSITLPESLKSIDSNAFSGCSALRSIVIPDGVESIGGGCFKGCSGLESVSFPQQGLKTIGGGCFEGCTRLISIILPRDIEEIGYGLFYGCSALKDVVIGEGINRLPDYCFWYCTSLEQVALPAGLTVIGESSFSGCENLRSVTAATKLTQIGVGAFHECVNLEVLPDLTEVTEVGYSAFGSCRKLTSLVFSDKLQTVSAGNNYYSGPCSGCESLVEVNLGNNVKVLPRQSFYGCRSLKSFKVPENCTVIGPGVFHYCTSLETITMPQRMESIGARDDMATGEVFRECNSLKSLRIPEGVKVLEYANIVRCTSLTQLTLPSTLERLEDWAIRGCPLTELHLPETVTYIGGSAIDLDDLKELTIPASVVQFGDNGSWLISENLKKLVFSDGPDRIEDMKHINIKNIEELYIGRDMGCDESYLEPYSGYRWETIKTLGIGGLVKDIRYLCMQFNEGLESITCSALTPPLCKEFSQDTYNNVTPRIDAQAYEAYRNAPVWKNFKKYELVGGLNGIGSVLSGNDVDYKEPFAVYNLQGMRVADSLESLTGGIYIIRQGNSEKKIVIR